jgi:AraC-like DNA-binding protein
VILDVEGKVTRIDKPAIQIVPPMHVHGFRFSKNVEGYVLTVALPLIQWLRENLRDLQTPFQHPGCYAVASDKPYIDLLYEKITQEYAAPAPGRDLLLRSLLSALLIWVERQHREMYQAAGNLDRAEFHLAAFSTLIERHYADHWPVSRFADKLGISAVQLNNVCRRLVGQSALEILHQRVLLEAQRNLTYTTMGVAQISRVFFGGSLEPHLDSFAISRAVVICLRLEQRRRTLGSDVTVEANPQRIAITQHRWHREYLAHFMPGALPPGAHLTYNYELSFHKHCIAS